MSEMSTNDVNWMTRFVFVEEYVKQFVTRSAFYCIDSFVDEIVPPYDEFNTQPIISGDADTFIVNYFKTLNLHDYNCSTCNKPSSRYAYCSLVDMTDRLTEDVHKMLEYDSDDILTLFTGFPRQVICPHCSKAECFQPLNEVDEFIYRYSLMHSYTATCALRNRDPDLTTGQIHPKFACAMLPVNTLRMIQFMHEIILHAHVPCGREYIDDVPVLDNSTCDRLHSLRLITHQDAREFLIKCNMDNTSYPHFDGMFETPPRPIHKRRVHALCPPCPSPVSRTYGFQWPCDPTYNFPGNLMHYLNDCENDENECDN